MEKPSEEEYKLFLELASGKAENLCLIKVEINGIKTACICCFEPVEGTDQAMFAPVAILVNDEIAKEIKLPDGMDEFKLPDTDLDLPLN